MKELLQEYIAYNAWANKTIIERISLLSEEQLNRTIASSFPSVYKTVLHLWQAESIWWQRLHLAQHITILSETFKGSFKELAEGFAAQNEHWKEWMNKVTDTELAQSFSYTRNKEQQTMVIHDMLLHVFNHATLHRGQLVTMLRQLGETSGIPSTDFSSYCRARGK